MQAKEEKDEFLPKHLRDNEMHTWIGSWLAKSTYSTFYTRPPNINCNQKPWYWLDETLKKEISNNNLSDIELLQKYSQPIDQRIQSSTASYIDISKSIDLGNGMLWTTLYRDQQDCVIWHAVGKPGSEIVVSYSDLPVKKNDIQWNYVTLIEPKGIEVFFYRHFIENTLWYHENFKKPIPNNDNDLKIHILEYKIMCLERLKTYT